MAPRKSKTAQTSSYSQPVPQTRRPRGAAQKRRPSDVSNASEAPSTTEAMPTFEHTPTERKKRTRAAAKSAVEVIVEEQSTPHQAKPKSDVHHPRVVNHTEDEIEDDPAAATEQDHDHASQSSSKQVRFDSQLSADNTSTATNITPHPRKMAIKRRLTLSPAGGDGPQTKRFKTNRGRLSLPSTMSQFSQEDAEDATTAIVQELQFAPLRSVLSERIRRRLRRSGLSEQQHALEDRDKRDMRALEALEAKEAELRALTLELETQRQFAMDVSTETSLEHEKLKSLESQLEDLKAELQLLHTNRVEFTLDEGSPDHNMMVLDSQQDIIVSQLPTPEPSQIEPNGVGADRDADADHDAVIGAAAPSSDAASACVSLVTNQHWEAERRAFEDAIVALSREANDAKAELQILHIELEALGFGASGIAPRAVLESIRSTFARVRDEMELLSPGMTDGGSTNLQVMEKLAALVKDLTEQLRGERMDLDAKDHLVTDLSKQVQGLLDHLADAEIRKQNLQQQWRELDESNETKAREMEDLEEELEATRREQDRLQEQLDARRKDMESLDEDNSTMVRNLERLTQSLDNYRKEESRLTDLITKMEEEHLEDITKMNREREETVQELESQLDKQTGLRSEAEEQVKGQATIIADLESQIQGLHTGIRSAEDLASTYEENLVSETHKREMLEGHTGVLDDMIAALRDDLDDMKRLNNSNENQRVAAEAQVDQLNDKLHQQGIEANGLRQKLFEIQQTNEAKVREMQELLSERDEQYQNDFAEEVGRREALETQLRQVEAQMRADIAQRDERITELEANLQMREGEVDALKSELRSAEEDGATSQRQHNQQQEQMQATVAELRETIVAQEEKLAVLESEAAGMKMNISDLEAEKGGLERRVEDEAEQMLQFQSDKHDEMEALKAMIRDKQQKILIVEEKAVEADRSWQEVLDARDGEIASLQVTSQELAESKVVLETDFATLKRKFQQHVHRSSSVIERLQEAILAAKAVADEEADLVKSEGEAILLELLELDDQESEIVVKQTHSTKSAKKRAGRRKRQQDSGIGLEVDEVEDESWLASV